MILYLSIITVCVLIISASLFFIFSTNFFYLLGFTALAAVLVIVIDALVATVCRLLPEKFANHESKVYTVSAKEKSFYEKLKIRKWKDKVPEIGHFTGFRKNKIAEPRNPEYIKRFLYEICYGEIGHTISIFSGCLPILFAIAMPSYLAYGIYIAVVNAVLNLLPVIVLRYNGYYLTSMFKRLKAKEVRV